MKRLKQAFSLPLCVAAICCSEGGGAPGPSAVSPQAKLKSAPVFTPPEQLRKADFSAPLGFSLFRDSEPQPPAADAPAPWRPQLKADAGLSSGSEWKTSDLTGALAPATDKPGH